MAKIWKIYGEDYSANTPDELAKEEARKIYDSPDVILNQYASQVYEDTNRQFKGLVTEAFGDDTNEVTYALYIIAPKLKDYMYRLIEVTVPNIIQPYPLEITLFAKDSKNNRTFICDDVTQFRNKLEELILSPVARVILSHLKTLIEINEQYEIKNYHFSLSDINPKARFGFTSTSSPINIKRIVLKSHLNTDPNVWGRIIANCYLEIITTNKLDNSKFVRPISLSQFYSLYQIQPILELKLIIPDYNVYMNSKLEDVEVEIKLIFSDSGITLEFFYDSDEQLIQLKN